MDEELVEGFRPTSGQVTGVIALVAVAAIVVIAMVDRESGLPAPVIAAALLVGVIVWSAMLRPRVWTTEHSLVMRNMFDTTVVPLAAIEEIAVRQVLAVRAGEKRYVSAAIGRSRRQAVRSGRPAPASTDAGPAAVNYPDFVEERIRRQADDARAKLGIQRFSDEQAALASGVGRRPAWVELGALCATSVAFVVTLLV